MSSDGAEVVGTGTPRLVWGLHEYDVTALDCCLLCCAKVPCGLETESSDLLSSEFVLSISSLLRGIGKPISSFQTHSSTFCFLAKLTYCHLNSGFV